MPIDSIHGPSQSVLLALVSDTLYLLGCTGSDLPQ